MSHIFISYSTQNSAYAVKLADKLRDEGFNVWIDNAKLRSGQNWWEEIVYALRECGAIIAVMTPEAKASKWVQREVALADNWNKPAFPVLLNGENWEIYVLTHYQDLRAGLMPPPEFYTLLAEHGLPRFPQRGENIRSKPRMNKPDINATMQQEISNPPPITEDNTSEPTLLGTDDKPTTLMTLPMVEAKPKSRLPLLFVVMVGILIGVGAILLLPMLQQTATAVETTDEPATSSVLATNTFEPSVTPTSDITNTAAPPSPTPLPGFTNGAAIEANDDWEIFEQNFDGIEMVLVPKGCFSMDADGSGGFQCFDEPYWIDRYEVTRRLWVECVVVGVCRAKIPNEFSDERNQPINVVDWEDAVDYCDWRGGRLPTEAEWEYAARGPDGLFFPWGNTFEETYLNYEFAPEYVENEDITPTTKRVGDYPEGVSWVGAYDMSGNVFEWTSSLAADYPYDPDDGRENMRDTTNHRILRGGSFQNGVANAGVTSRIDLNPRFGYNSVGFRCVYPYIPTNG